MGWVRAQSGHSRDVAPSTCARAGIESSPLEGFVHAEAAEPPDWEALETVWQAALEGSAEDRCARRNRGAPQGEKSLSRGRPAAPDHRRRPLRCLAPRGPEPSGISTGQLARPRRIVAEGPDLETRSLAVDPRDVGSGVGAGVRDVLRRGEHPPAIRVDVGVEGELRPSERSTDESDALTQGAIAVVGVVSLGD